MEKKYKITHTDIISMEEYAKIRLDRRKEVTRLKLDRRLNVGPYAVFYFENYETMFHQIHEMLWIEKGGENQIEDELFAYNPLIPDGHELVATLMFQINEPVRRASFLSKLGGVEEAVYIAFDGIKTIFGTSEEDVERTNDAGKASSVQFLHFKFTDSQIKLFKDKSVETSIGINHQTYGHIAVFPEYVKDALSADFL